MPNSTSRSGGYYRSYIPNLYPFNFLYNILKVFYKQLFSVIIVLFLLMIAKSFQGKVPFKSGLNGETKNGTFLASFNYHYRRNNFCGYLNDGKAIQGLSRVYIKHVSLPLPF